jgi:hypothetical protein
MGFTLCLKRFISMFGLGSNSFKVTGTPCTNEVTITVSLVVWITWSLNLAKPLTMMVRDNIRGTGIVLQVHWDSVNPIEKGLRAHINHMKKNYD